MKATGIKYQGGNLHTVDFGDGMQVDAWLGIDGLTICPMQFRGSGRKVRPGTARHREAMRAITEPGFSAHSLDRFAIPY